MRLTRAVIVSAGPFDRIELAFAEEDRPRPLTVLHARGGLGKTTVLQGIAATRPGHCVVQWQRSEAAEASDPVPHASCDWLLGADDPGRPHLLTTASPNVRLFAGEEAEALRRREQAYYDRLASDGGFVFLAIPSTRWFSRQPFALSAPLRGVARYDPKAPLAVDDATRTELSRDTKQALAYAAIAEALSSPRSRQHRRFDLLGAAMQAAVDRLVDLAGFRYRGIDAGSLEPLFEAPHGKAVSFDALPTRARHLAAFAALSVRVLWAAYPDQDPRDAEGVLAIDDIELHQDEATLGRLAGALREAFPAAQWLITTASPVVASSAAVSEVLTLRRLDDSDAVAVFSGAEARTH